MSAEFAVAAMGRGVCGVVLPREIVDIIRRLTFECEPMLVCDTCKTTVLAEDDELWVTRRQRIEWHVTPNGFLVDTLRGRFRAPLLGETIVYDACRLIRSPSVFNTFTPFAIQVDGVYYPNRIQRLVQLLPYFRIADTTYCYACRAKRRRLRRVFRGWVHLARAATR